MTVINSFTVKILKVNNEQIRRKYKSGQAAYHFAIHTLKIVICPSNNVARLLTFCKITINMNVQLN